ncbi:apolipoprotein N-acyltransferase [Sulfitobacter aestuariivivens]|uniref:apolipoprotein N-acyltransferase n=1 Tax=Sulfitobacter aestuariivivens TaxID=2766981 RepID=UPI00360F5DE8
MAALDGCGHGWRDLSVAFKGYPLRAALMGWAFGTGYFIHALQWIVSPFLVDVARHGWMAPFALLFMGAGLALFWGAAFWSARKLSPRPWPLIVTWSAAELLRAYVFTGFPWAMPAQSTVDVLAGQALAHFGPYAINLWLISVCVVLIWGLRARRSGQIAAGVAGFGALFALILPPGLPAQAGLDMPVIRLIQPNAAQHEKWNPEKIPVFYDRQLQLTSAAPLGDRPPPDLILWSETAIPWAIDLAGSALEEIARAGGDATVALGAQRRTETRYFNSMVTLDGQGA